jgi:hypothetical protein
MVLLISLSITSCRAAVATAYREVPVATTIGAKEPTAFTAIGARGPLVAWS